MTFLALLGALTVAGCDDQVAPPFEVTGTGTLEGLVFYDADEDGAFNRTSGDSALAGVDVVVRARSTEQTFNDGAATTGADGRFVISGLPLGTHDLLIDTLSAPASLQFCQNPVPVTIYLGTEDEAVAGRSSCLITIAQAEDRAADAEYVTVSGVVTSSPDQITSSNTFVQDETGGILVFGSLDSSIEVGDFIEVSGTVIQYFETMEITNPVLKKLVPDYGELTPALVTTAEIASDGPLPGEFLQGTLVTVEAAELVVEFGGGGINERNAKINDGSGQTELRVYGGVVSDASTLNDLYTVGKCYDITGVIGEFAAVGQIYPRTVDDIVEVTCP